MNMTLQALRVLARARWRIIVNTYWRVGVLRRVLTLLLLPLGGGAAWLIFVVSRGAVRVLLSPDVQRELPADLPLNALLDSVPSLVFGAVLLIVLLNSVGSAISALFFSADLEMLLLAPIPLRSVFIAKLTANLGGAYALLIFIGLMPLLGYGLARNYGPLYFVMLPLVLLATPLLPTGIGAVLAIGVLRIVPSRRAREVLGALSGLIGLSCYFGSQLVRRFDAGSWAADNADLLLQGNSVWLPSAWAGRALQGAGQGDTAALRYAALFVGASLLVFYGGALVTERMYYTGWLAVSGESNARRRQRRQRMPRDRRIRTRGPTAAIIRKDLRVLPRDIRNILQFIWPLGFAAFWFWQLFTNDVSAARSTPALLYLSGIGIGLFISSTISSRLAQAAISREGRTFWLIQVAPVAPLRVVWSKALLAWAPFPLVGTLTIGALLALAQLPLMLAVVGWLAYGVLGAGMAAIQTGIGAAFPVLNWEQPEKMIGLRAGCIGALVGWGYLGLAGGLLVAGTLPWTLPLLDINRDIGTLGRILGGAALLGAIIITAFAVWLPLRLGADRLEQLEVA